MFAVPHGVDNRNICSYNFSKDSQRVTFACQ